MKINVKLVFGNQEKIIAIPCGTGNKTFKWLGIVASERFSKAAPNGYLRRMDEFCAISDQAQYHPSEIMLADGEIPSPEDMIYDLLRDGDEITITLRSKQSVEDGVDCPSPTKWGSMAYSLSSPMKDESKIDDNNSETEVTEDEDPEEIVIEDPITIKAKSDFMRILLNSQIINHRKIEHIVNTEWDQISMNIPRLKPEDNANIKDVFAANWDVIQELFQMFAPSGSMLSTEFSNFVEESGVFPAISMSYQAKSIYSRVCKYLSVTEKNFSPACLLVAILLCAQAKYNDTMDSKISSISSYEALEYLFANNFRPLAKRMNAHSLLKDEFCSDLCLSKLQPYYHELHLFFDKYAAKVRDIPSTVPVENVAVIFDRADLIDDKEDVDQVATFLKDIRRGTIYGRSLDDEGGDEEDREKSMHEFSFAEFMEASCRAGFAKFYKKEMPDGVVVNTVHDAFIKGITAVLSSTNVSSKQSSHKGKGNRGQRKR